MAQKILTPYCMRQAVIYRRFAEKNINVLSVTKLDRNIGDDINYDACVATIEYAYKRPKDGKLIWPKMVTTGTELIDMLENAEAIIDAIRSN